jgi:site-specific recombinase XerD
VSAAVAARAGAGREFPHVLAGIVLAGAAARLAALLDPVFLAGAGWDPVTQVLAPPAGHRFVRRNAAALPEGGKERAALPLAALVCAAPVPGPQACAVLACLRARRNRRAAYCSRHAAAWELAAAASPGLDERSWRQTAAPFTVAGQVNLRGLAPLAVVEILYGVQQRARDECMTYCRFLRRLAYELHRAQASRLGELPGQQDVTLRALVNSLTRHVARAFTDPETETAKDAWDLAVLGHRGRLAFTKISQPWLREAAKRWAMHDLPRRRGQKAGNRVSEIIGAVMRLSASLRAHRSDHGDDPACLGRADIEAFLHRVAFLFADGQISAYGRVKTCQDTGRVLAEIRALGLTRAGGPAAGLGPDFALTACDVPAKAADGEPGRDIPAAVMRQICSHLAELETMSCRETRTAVELLMDTGRRPAEVCTLAWDCLEYDAGGGPVLVYDNSKGNRARRRLPVSEHTAALITGQKLAVRERFPATSPGELRLLPSKRRNPAGRRPVTADNLMERHRIWIDSMGPLLRSDGTEHDKALITCYSYRHSYAQRLADAGVGVDVLRDLMDHTSMNTPRRYYRVGEGRRREAIDKVTAMCFDRHGNRIWREAHALLDFEHARYAIAEVAVPYGTCAEPSNVKAGGGACPVRFRCAGCDHFRTNVSYLPDLAAYLDDLLRTRERLAAATDGIDEWARADAMPAEEEIVRIRRLINRIKGEIAQLTSTERAQIDEAVTVVRHHRAVHLGMPSIRAALPARMTGAPA